MTYAQHVLEQAQRERNLLWRAFVEGSILGAMLGAFGMFLCCALAWWVVYGGQ